jgi:hypothetical protein
MRPTVIVVANRISPTSVPYKPALWPYSQNLAQTTGIIIEAGTRRLRSMLPGASAEKILIQPRDGLARSIPTERTNKPIAAGRAIHISDENAYKGR